jgi:hypothetical protein
MTLAFQKNPSSSIGMEIRPQSAFTAFTAHLPSASYSAELSGQVWQPAADSNGYLEYFEFEASQTAIFVNSWLPFPTQQVQIFKKMCQTSINICSGLSYPIGWAALP